MKQLYEIARDLRVIFEPKHKLLINKILIRC